MSQFEDLSNEILMSIFEYMNIEDIWRIFFHMNKRLNSLIYDTRLRLTVDLSKINQKNFDEFCLTLLTKKFHNIFTLILSNHHNIYPKIQQFLFYTNFQYFSSLYSLILIDINYDELIEITKQIRQLINLQHLHINTHEIFLDQQLTNVTIATFNQPNIRVLGMNFHQKIQWNDIQIISLSNIEVLLLNFINIHRLLLLLSQCPRLRSLSMTLNSYDDISISKIDNLIIYSHIIYLRFYFRPFNVDILERLLKSLPSIKYFSLDTIIYNSDYYHAPFWTYLFQKYLTVLERIRLILRGFYLLQLKDIMNGIQDNIIDGYRYDRYWIEKVYKKIFILNTINSSTVLQIR